MSEEKYTVLVLGGTGAQGGSVVNALLKNPHKWNIRVLSRNPQSEKSISLQQRGCEVVKGDFDDHDGLVKSLEGVDFAFLLTNFWQPPFTKEAEIAQGKKFADAVLEAKPSKLKAIVFSTLPNADSLSNGKIKVPHLDSKAEIEKYLNDVKLPSINIGISHYMDNFLSSFCPIQKLDKDKYLLGYPLKPEDRISLTDISEYGPVFVSAIENYKEYLGKTIYVTSDVVSIQDIAKTIQEVTGFDIQLSNISPEDYAKLPIPFAGELADMYRFFGFSTILEKDLALMKKIHGGKTITWKEFVEKTWKDWEIFKK